MSCIQLEGKKITFMARRFSHGGAERATALLCNHFVAQGLDVTALATEGRDENEAFVLDGRIKRVYLNPGGVNAIGKVKRLAGLEGYLLRERPDVIICLAGPMRYLIPTKAHKRCNLVLSERNWPPLLYSDADFAQVEGLYRNAAKVVFQTPDARDCFCEEVQAKSAVIPNMVMANLPARSCETTNKIVAVGRLDPQKNYDLLLEAFALFANEDKNGFVLDIYGEGSANDSIADHLRSRACELGIADHVNFLGFCPDVHERIADACMYVTPSDFEGLQNSLMEAMAMGIPCVATDCLGGGARLITDGGRRGLLVPCGDAGALAEAMADVAASAELRERLSAAGQEIRELYSVDSICDQWIRYIEGGLSGPA